MAGSYVSYPPTAATIMAVEKWAAEHEQEPPRQLHVTLFTSAEKAIPRSVIDAMSDLSPQVFAVKGVEVIGKENLVMLLEAPGLVEKHEELKAKGFKHKFFDYKTHMTLCYCDEAADAQALMAKIKDTNDWPEIKLNPRPVLAEYKEDWRPDVANDR